jgi:hypothetical protein
MFLSRPIACALALAALSGACRRGPPAIHVASVRVVEGELAEPLREVGLEAPAMEGAARDALVLAGFKSGEGRRTYRARLSVVSLRVTPGLAGDGIAEIAVELELLPAEEGAGGAALVETGVGSAPASPGAAPAAWRAALHEAVREAAAGLSVAAAQQAKPLERLIADLESEDARVREHAVEALADRRNAAAVPPLIARLRDPDPEVVQRAVGALAQIRDPRAVGPLIDVSRREDAAFTARLARIIGDIGGSEARGYLLTLEAGHSDPRVQTAAREALRELDAREKEAARVAAGR